MNEKTLVTASSHFGNPIPVYDDGIGHFYLFRDADFRIGVIRAESQYTAYEIVEDEILEPIPLDDFPEAYGLWVQATYEGSGYKPKPPYKVCFESYLHGNREPIPFPTRNQAYDWACDFIANNELDLAEGYAYQSNATGTGIVLHSLNGEFLEEVDPKNLFDYEIIPIWETED